MGKAADRRRRAQIQHLAALAADPLRFREAITKRLESQAALIAEKAGRLDSAVFPIANKLRSMLIEVAAVAVQAGSDVSAEIADANDTLTSACCSELARHACREGHTGETYRLTMSSPRGS